MRLQALHAALAPGGKPLAPRARGTHLLSSWPGRYGVALAGPLAALLLHQSLWPLMPTIPFMFFFLAVMVAGWWVGWGPGWSR